MCNLASWPQARCLFKLNESHTLFLTIPISDAGWYQFRLWIERYGEIFGKVTVAVELAYTSQECSICGTIVKKSLSTRTHVCKCGCELDRDENAAINILNEALSTTGHVGTALLDKENAL